MKGRLQQRPAGIAQVIANVALEIFSSLPRTLFRCLARQIHHGSRDFYLA